MNASLASLRLRSPRLLHPALVLILSIALAPVASADLLEALGLRKRGRALANLTEEQLTQGLREALAQGAESAVKELGRADGFLKDARVRIPLPPALQRIESGARTLGKGALVDEFVTTINRAAEEAVPQAGAVLGDAIRQMTLADARAILASTNTAATDFFRRTSETNLHARLLPIVKNATAKTGVTARYKSLVDLAGASTVQQLGNLGGLGGFLKNAVGAESLSLTHDLDLDDYVTRKSLDGLFLKIADEERRIRENPSARTTDLLRRMFR